VTRGEKTDVVILEQVPEGFRNENSGKQMRFKGGSILISRHGSIQVSVEAVLP
jgi:hypothetical protein